MSVRSSAKHGVPGSPSVPLYAQIQAALKERIVTGRYPVGSQLPIEAELCLEFGASRHTVREALRRLSEQGLVERRQGAGTLVRSAEPVDGEGYVQSVASIADLFQHAMDTHFVVLATEMAALDAAICERVGGRVGEPWLKVTGVRWSKPGGHTISYVQSYVPLRFQAIVPEFSATRGPFYALLEERSGEVIEEVLQEIEAVPMPRCVSDTLGLEVGSLSLRLLRRYVTKAGTLIASFNWHRGADFIYRMQLHRRSRNGHDAPR